MLFFGTLAVSIGLELLSSLSHSFEMQSVFVYSILSPFTSHSNDFFQRTSDEKNESTEKKWRYHVRPTIVSMWPLWLRLYNCYIFLSCLQKSIKRKSSTLDDLCCSANEFYVHSKTKKNRWKSWNISLLFIINFLSFKKSNWIHFFAWL